MNSQSLATTTELTPPALPCSVLAELRGDLAAIVKTKTLPFSRLYNITDKEFIVISLKKLDDGQFHMEVKSLRGSEEATDPKLKKLIDLAHLYTWKALSLCLSRNSLTPCSAMAHSGADEVLALYSCIDTFRKNMALPFVFSVDGPSNSYELFSVKQKDSHYEVAFETNNIYGKSMKWKAEMQSVHQALERADKILAEVLSEWIMPGGQLLRAERERVNGGAPVRNAK